MKPIKLLVLLLIASLFGGFVALVGYKLVEGQTPEKQPSIEAKQEMVLSKYGRPAGEALFADSSSLPIVAKSGSANKIVAKVPQGLNFTVAAEKATPAVVHIKTTYNGYASQYGKNSFEDMFRDLFGEEAPSREYFEGRGQQTSSGSGVIITEDGYIATNYHVVEDAQSIQIVMDDKRSFDAEVIGTDPSTDLALLKVEQAGLPFIAFGNSDDVKIGEWVLAVGNPFDLTSTVTAGIVSAKARNINILRRGNNLSIESFIQTDAAVNPGNSGGALVDLNGNLVGINTAIATRTGSYAGYSFAVPVALVEKVMEDLVAYGKVQRALMGVSIADVDANIADQKGLDKVEGVYILGVAPRGGAADAGIKGGDVIISVEGVAVDNVAELQELVARNRPGDEVKVGIKRDNLVETYLVQLKNVENGTEILRNEEDETYQKERLLGRLGAELEPVAGFEKENLRLEYGLKILRLREGLLQSNGIEEGFIITHIDKSKITSQEDLYKALKGKKGGILIEGIYSDGEKAFYGLEMR